MVRLLSLVALAALATGCVTQGTYDRLAADHAAMKQDLSGQVARLGEDLAGEQTRAKTLEEALAAEQVRAKALEEAIARLEADKAAILKDRSRLQSSVGEMQLALAELSKRKHEADARIAEYRNLVSRFQALIDAGKLRVKIVEGRMVVELPTDVLFGSGSAKLSKEGRAAIGEVAGLLATIPQRKFQVEGHTDDVPIATAQYPSNWELAAARALTVVRAMIDGGLPPDRISAASFGEQKPARANDTPEGRTANRRIEIVVVPDLSGLPGFDELNRAAQGL